MFFDKPILYLLHLNLLLKIKLQLNFARHRLIILNHLNQIYENKIFN